MLHAPVATKPREREQVVNLLVHYLSSRAEPIESAILGARESTIERGRKLFHTVGCVACHAPDDNRKLTVSPVPLDGLGHETTVPALQKFLLDPCAIRPAGRMPDLALGEQDARDIAMYLLRAQSLTRSSPDSGLVPPTPRQRDTAKSPGFTPKYVRMVSPRSKEVDSPPNRIPAPRPRSPGRFDDWTRTATAS